MAAGAPAWALRLLLLLLLLLLLAEGDCGGARPKAKPPLRAAGLDLRRIALAAFLCCRLCDATERFANDSSMLPFVTHRTIGGGRPRAPTAGLCCREPPPPLGTAKLPP